MVLGNYVIEDMGGAIQDFGGIGPILLPMAIAGFGIIISIIGTLLVKISSNDAKESQVQPTLNIVMDFYCLSGRFMFCFGKMDVTC